MMETLEQTTLRLRPLAEAAIFKLCGPGSAEDLELWTLFIRPASWEERHRKVMYWVHQWSQMQRNGITR